MFGFDEQAVMFDSTPVENQFILEYMLTANGDFVKVYLYGLMQCYHPVENMDLTRMANDLCLTEDDVLKAYRYWERRGLVRRVQDKPPVYRYMNVNQHAMMGAAAQADPAYEAFAESVYSLFGNDRRIHGKELSQCYEWVEDLGLPQEVVIMLLQHSIATRGKSFSIKSAEKLAVSLAAEGVRDIEDAEAVLGRERTVWDGSRRVLRRMGKRRDPSEDEMTMYRRWIRDWGYSPDAIEAACAEMTRGDPSFAYLDGILKGMLQRRGKAMTSGREMEEAQAREQERVAPVKAMLNALGARDATVNAGTIRVYEDLKTMYPDEIILLAAKECAARGGRLDDVQALLESWQRRDLRTAEDVEAHLAKVKRQDSLLRLLYDAWGSRARPNSADRALAKKWLEDQGQSPELIAFCAGFCAGADKPIAYLDSILTDYAARGIATPEAAAQDRAARRETAPKPAAGKQQSRTVPAQQYEQREYTVSTELPDWMKKRLEEMEHDA